MQSDVGSIWSSLGFYIFSIHVPLSFGGLSAASKILHQPHLNPQVEAFLLLGIQILELGLVLLLFKPQYNLHDFFRGNKSSKTRSIFLPTLLGFGFLLLLVFVTSYYAQESMGSQDTNNSFVKEILSSGSSSAICCVVVYCFLTPLMEEIVYRSFLLTYLSSKMKWQQAVAVSALVFSAVHFSTENFLQLFVIGIVLGCSYCWTGSLASPFAIHLLYNSLIMFLVFMS